MRQENLSQGGIGNHTEHGERLLLAVDVGVLPEQLREQPVPLARLVRADDLKGDGVPVLDVPDTTTKSICRGGWRWFVETARPAAPIIPSL